MKLSYSCCRSMKNIIVHGQYQEPKSNCSCRDSGHCPLDQRCMMKSIIYNAEVSATLNNNTPDKKTYVGWCEGEFKNRYANHIASFWRRDESKSTELASYVWNIYIWDSTESRVMLCRAHQLLCHHTMEILLLLDIHQWFCSICSVYNIYRYRRKWN